MSVAPSPTPQVHNHKTVKEPGSAGGDLADLFGPGSEETNDEGAAIRSTRSVKRAAPQAPEGEDISDELGDDEQDEVEEPAEEDDAQEAAAEDAPVEGEDGFIPDSPDGEPPPADAASASTKSAIPDPIVQVMQQQHQVLQQTMQTIAQQNAQVAMQAQQAQDQILALMQNAQEQRAAQELARSKPKLPENATQEQFEHYIESLADWKAEQRIKQTNSGTIREVSQVKQQLAQLQQEMTQKQQELESQRMDAQVSTMVSQIQSMKGYEFLKDEGNKEMFLDLWWAACGKSQNGIADPLEVAKKMRIRAFNGVQKQTVSTGKKQLAKNQRTAQNASGAPKVLRGGGALSNGSRDPSKIAADVVRMYRSGFDVGVG